MKAAPLLTLFLAIAMAQLPRSGCSRLRSTTPKSQRTSPAPKTTEQPPRPDPSIVRLQVLLDRAGASPGVIDGYDGENVRAAIAAFETMHHLPVDGCGIPR